MSRERHLAAGALRDGPQTRGGAGEASPVRRRMEGRRRGGVEMEGAGGGGGDGGGGGYGDRRASSV